MTGQYWRVTWNYAHSPFSALVHYLELHAIKRYNYCSWIIITTNGLRFVFPILKLNVGKLWVFATNSDILIPIFLQPNVSQTLDISNINSVRSNNISLKYQRYTQSGCTVIGGRKYYFVAKTQFLNQNDLTKRFVKSFW